MDASNCMCSIKPVTLFCVTSYSLLIKMLVSAILSKLSIGFIMLVEYLEKKSMVCRD
jgi:hypothetical protein